MPVKYIHFQCASCSTKMTAAVEFAGRKSKCRKCGCPVTVPLAEPTEAATATRFPRGGIRKFSKKNLGILVAVSIAWLFLMIFGCFLIFRGRPEVAAAPIPATLPPVIKAVEKEDKAPVPEPGVLVAAKEEPPVVIAEKPKKGAETIDELKARAKTIRMQLYIDGDPFRRLPPLLPWKCESGQIGKLMGHFQVRGVLEKDRVVLAPLENDKPIMEKSFVFGTKGDGRKSFALRDKVQLSGFYVVTDKKVTIVRKMTGENLEVAETRVATDAERKSATPAVKKMFDLKKELEEVEERIAAATVGVSRANYNKITDGMNNKEVRKILGPWRENARSGELVFVSWREGSCIISITFRGGYVYSKSIIGD